MTAPVSPNLSSSLPVEGVEPAPLVAILDSPRGRYALDAKLEKAVLEPHAATQLCFVERAAEAGELLEEAAAIIAWHHIPLTQDAFRLMKRCKGVVRASVGIDNVSIDAAQEFGIPLCNVPDYGTEEVADHALMLLLAVSRNLLALVDSTRAGDWDWQAIGPAHRLRDRRVGVVGLGRIGMAMVPRVRALGAEAIGYDPYVPDGVEKALGIKRTESLEALLRQSDILTLHVPLTRETEGLLGSEELALLPAGALVVNTSRGKVIDQGALIESVSTGHVAGAGLDVLEDEPRVPPELRAHPRVVLTAHSGFYSVESLAELRTKAAEAALRFLKGEPNWRNQLTEASAPLSFLDRGAARR